MQLAITIACLVVIVLMAVQLYRILSWQHLISKKQSEFGNFKLKDSTKPYVAGLATSCVFMVMINLPIANNFTMKSMYMSEENAIERMTITGSMEEDSLSVAALQSYDESSIESSAVVTSSNDMLTKTMDTSGVTMLASFMAEQEKFSYAVKKINQDANEYSDEQIVEFFKNKVLSYSYEKIEDCDYELTLTSEDQSDVETYTLKEYDTYFIVCDDEYQECYYVYK